MRKEKRGISLIALVITIAVIIILASAVILSISGNNPIENARKASFLNDMSIIKDEFEMYVHNKMIETDAEFETSEIDGVNIKNVTPSISEKYVNKIEILNGKLQYTDTSNMKEYIWAKEYFEGMLLSLDVAKKEDSTLEISNAIEEKVENLKIYGNTLQNESIGNTGKNLFNMMAAANGNTILDNGDGTLTVTFYGTSAGTLKKLAPKLKVGDKVTYSIKTTGVSALVIGSGASQKYIANNTSFEVTQEMLDSNIWLYSKSSAGEEAVISSMQLEYGEVATSYEPYANDCLVIPIKVSGKNLFDISKITTVVGSGYSGNRDTYSSISDGIITSKIGVYDDVALLYDSKITLSPGTYTISADFMADKDSGHKGAAIGIRDLFVNKSDVKYYTLSNYKKWERLTHTFTLDKELDIAVITQGLGQKDEYRNLNIKIKNIQLERANKVTDYETYYSKIYNVYLNEPLRKLDNAVDYIDFKNKKIVRKVEEIDGVLKKLDTPKVESIDLPDIFTKNGINIISVETSIAPSSIEVIYSKE